MSDARNNDVLYRVRGETKANKIKFNYQWVIHGFDYIGGFPDQALPKSTSFQIPENLGIVKMALNSESPWPYDVSDEYYDVVTGTHETRWWITLKIKMQCSLGLAAKVDAVVISTTGEEIGKQVERSALPHGRLDLVNLISFEHLKKRRWAANKTITIHCDFEILTSFDQRSPKLLSLQHSLSHELGNLLKDSSLSDVTITVGDRVFNAHKSILSARSSVFRAMFHNDMTESNENNVKIVEMSEDVVAELLQFIYTDRTDKIDEMTMGLFYAAEKYDIENLKVLCAQNLHQKVENLILADRYQAEYAKANILQFISHCKNNIIGTAAYNAMKESHPHLVIEALEAVPFQPSV